MYPRSLSFVVIVVAAENMPQVISENADDLTVLGRKKSESVPVT